jgi:hypothetical protein
LQEAATYRGRMKDYCRTMFRPYYADALGLDDQIDNQLAFEEHVSRNVVQLIGKESKFHYGPIDALVSSSTVLQTVLIFFQGKKSNLAHPCIGALIINFFYGPGGGVPSIAKQFPADFQASVPEHAVAMAMVCVSTSFALLKTLTISCRYIIALMNIEPAHDNYTT